VSTTDGPTDAFKDFSPSALLAAAMRQAQSDEPSSPLYNNTITFLPGGHEDSYLKAESKSMYRMGKMNRANTNEFKYSSGRMEHSNSAGCAVGRGKAKNKGELTQGCSKSANVDSSYNSGSSTCDESDSVRSYPSSCNGDAFCVIPEPRVKSSVSMQLDSSVSLQPVYLAELSVPGTVDGSAISEVKGFLVARPGIEVSSRQCISVQTDAHNAMLASNTPPISLYGDNPLPMGRGKRLEMLLNAMSPQPGFCSSPSN